MKKAIKILIAAAAVISACLIAAAIAYINSDDYTSKALPEGVRINGLDCSGMSYGEAADELTDYWNGRRLLVVGTLDEKLAEYTGFGCTYDIADEIAGVKRGHLIKSALNHYLHIPYSARIAMRVRRCGGGFMDRVASSPFLSHGNVRESRNAYVDMSDRDFEIIPEVYGNKADTDAYCADIIKGIELGSLRFKFDEKNYLDIPEVRSDDRDLLRRRAYCRKNLSQRISYELGSDSFTISASDLEDLLASSSPRRADEAAATKYVAKMAKKYDTLGDEIEFTSLTGKTFKVSGGNYGWVIDRAAETRRLIDDINSGRDVSREPVFSSRGRGGYSRNLGNTYIDVDITDQHVIFFKNGKNVFETDCVTGCLYAGHATPTGVFHVLNKLRNITLKGGSKKKKTYYESFVNYWMCFYGGSYGLHDASWRSSFGGEIYKYGGSHGCVNLPPAKTPELFKLVETGTPVIVHY